MMSKYERLIFLAEEGAYGDEMVLEENQLLDEFATKENIHRIESEDYKMLDELITVLFLTNNIFEEYKENIEILQSFLRSKLS